MTPPEPFSLELIQHGLSRSMLSSDVVHEQLGVCTPAERAVLLDLLTSRGWASLSIGLANLCSQPDLAPIVSALELTTRELFAPPAEVLVELSLGGVTLQVSAYEFVRERGGWLADLEDFRTDLFEKALAPLATLLASIGTPPTLCLDVVVDLRHRHQRAENHFAIPSAIEAACIRLREEHPVEITLRFNGLETNDAWCSHHCRCRGRGCSFEPRLTSSPPSFVIDANPDMFAPNDHAMG